MKGNGEEKKNEEVKAFKMRGKREKRERKLNLKMKLGERIQKWGGKKKIRKQKEGKKRNVYVWSHLTVTIFSDFNQRI